MTGDDRTSDPAPEPLRTTLGRIARTEEGPSDAPVVFCIHGIPGSTRDFRYLAPWLCDDFRVIRLDMPGFGASPVGQVRSLDGWSRVPSAVADALGVRRFYLMSHSFGGGAVIRAALRERGRVLGIALLASNGARRHRAWAMPPPLIALLKELLERPLLASKLFEVGARQYEKLGLPPPRDVDELRTHLAVMATQRFRLIGRLAPRVRVPALVAFCKDDRLIEVEIARELAGLFPRGLSFEFEEGGHHLQKHRAVEIAEAFRRLFS